MEKAQAERFKQLLDDLAEVYGREPFTKGALRLWWQSLRGYSLEEVEAAVIRHQSNPKTGRFFPRPGDLIAAMPGRPVRIDGREAWNRALMAADERETVIWTDEIGEAWAACSMIWADGDKIGARMAFIAAYERITADPARHPKLQISIGTDPQKRQEVLLPALERGEVSPQFYLTHCGTPEGENSVARLMDGTAKVLRLAARDGQVLEGEAERQIDFAKKFRESVERGMGERIETKEDRQRMREEAEQDIADREPLPIPGDNKGAA